MHIFRRIRMMMVRIMMVRLIARATRHHELRATCFPRGGVPTMSFSPFSSLLSNVKRWCLLPLFPRLTDQIILITPALYQTCRKINLVTEHETAKFYFSMLEGQSMSCFFFSVKLQSLVRKKIISSLWIKHLGMFWATAFFYAEMCSSDAMAKMKKILGIIRKVYY